MKKVLFAAVAVLALASCKKDYVCKGGLLDGAVYTKLDKTAKGTAETQCQVAGGSLSAK